MLKVGRKLKACVTQIVHIYAFNESDKHEYNIVFIIFNGHVISEIHQEMKTLDRKLAPKNANINIYRYGMTSITKLWTYGK